MLMLLLVLHCGPLLSLCALQAALDTLDAGIRFVDYFWHNWGDVEQGGPTKPSRVLSHAHDKGAGVE